MTEIRRGFSALVCMMFVAALLVGCSQGNTQPEPTEIQALQTTLAEPSDASEPTVEETAESEKTIETAYLPVQISGEYVQNLEHRRVTEDSRAMEIFTMVKDNTEVELFRIYFDEEETGSYLGSLEVDGEEIPVTLEVPEYSDEMFADEESRTVYYELMDTLNGVVETIQQDDRFSSNEKIPVQTEETQLSYWNFTLPAGMEQEESTEAGNYLATFYGNVNGSRYKLYSVALGEVTLRTVLGTYSVNGVPCTVSVESEELPVTDGWPDNAVLELYKMMESINDVIQTIMQSEGFSNQTPETP